MKLNREQSRFIEEEFGVELEADREIQVPADVRKKLHDSAFEVEAEELPAHDGDPWSRRCELAVSVCDLMYEG